MVITMLKLYTQQPLCSEKECIVHDHGTGGLQDGVSSSLRDDVTDRRRGISVDAV